jgi:SAM-dependent methyltransferase
MNKNIFSVQFWRRLSQEKSLESDSYYLSHSRSLRRLYERYGASQLGLVDSISLDLGCGGNLRNPFGCDKVYGVDTKDDASRDVMGADLVTGPIPFPSSSFDYVTAYDFLEHIPRIIYAPDRRLPFIELMNEVWRVLKPGGIFLSHTPIYPYASVFRDPTHVNIMTVETFSLYFDDQMKWGSTYGFIGAFEILDQTIKKPHLISVLKKVQLGMTDSSTFLSGHSLNEDQRLSINAFLDEIIPASDFFGMPNASNTNFLSFIQKRNLTDGIEEFLRELNFFSKEKYGLQFNLLDSLQRSDVISLIKSKRVHLFFKVITCVANCYYEDVNVLRALGLNYTLFPEGAYLQEGDFGLLEPVYERGIIYRETKFSIGK